MSTTKRRAETLFLSGAAALALAASPIAFDYASHHGLSVAAAQSKGGKGGSGGSGGSGQGSGGQKGGKGGQSGSQGGSTQDVLRGSKPAAGSKGGSSGESGSETGGAAGKLGRLSMAKSFLSPGFDITKLDDPSAPLAQVYAYSVIVGAPLPSDDPATPENEQTTAIDAAGNALGSAATVVPVTLTTIKNLNTAAGFTTSWSDAALTQVAAVATSVVEARRTEEGEGETTTTP